MLFVHRGVLKYERNEFEDAVQDFTEALQIEEKANIYLYRAQCFCMLQLLDGATNDLLEVQRLDEGGECLEKQENLERLVDELIGSKTNKNLLEIQKLGTEQETSPARIKKVKN